MAIHKEGDMNVSNYHGSSKTTLTVSLFDAMLAIKDRIKIGFNILNDSSAIKNDTDLKTQQNKYYAWDSYNTDLLKKILTTPDISEEYSRGKLVYILGRNESIYDRIKEHREDVDNKIQRLQNILGRLELFTQDNTQVDTQAVRPSNGTSTKSKRIFIVHGHDDAARESVARFITNLGLEPIILHEVASSGKTIIEKIESYSDVCFAIVLLTPDDVGHKNEPGANQKPRARQNVIFELGYFAAKLQRKNVVAMVKDDVEKPSDVDGVIYIPLDQHDGWKIKLSRELMAAGIEIDTRALTY